MIYVMAEETKILDGFTKPGKYILFKLTDSEDGKEILSKRLREMRVGGNILKMLGYSQVGEEPDEDGLPSPVYAPVERMRFDNGPQYYRMLLGPTSDGWTVLELKKFTPDVSTGEMQVKVEEVQVPPVAPGPTPRRRNR